jgi:hypothetical protein
MPKCSIGHQQIGSALFYLVDPSKGTYWAKQGAMTLDRMSAISNAPLACARARRVRFKNCWIISERCNPVMSDDDDSREES